MKKFSYLLRQKKILCYVSFMVAFFFTQIVFGQPKANSEKIQCDDSLWNRVYHSYRLQVIEKCKSITGIVAEAKFETDGDAHISIQLDSGQEYLLYPMNYEKQHGYLIVEPVCATLIDGKPAEEECIGYINKVYLPQIGEHVRVTGSYVLDTKHSWTEIHPVTSITPLKN